ncbi:uncharacterized protein BT62DRAFT_1004762 [Guyanagaster necrorhizus]|uniref:DUF6533 domain-containing protein n=1 Tax=Guyanagaster necrorhizus TaxID=856835 RepID=A0A9P8AUR6_9AGAR|nr:uncharacterized protein BT62DRAFT_1004762 [Guyanagaster necrorhizus MCA 3950]KAG7447187.1 hypothetical protein BT62DRAFT_1004762 [Guyanagaster necrorhizus MCA 3950]
MAESDDDMARQAWAVSWVAGACATCIVYDHIITFGEECNHIWTARMTLARVLFFVNRYVVEGMLLFAFIGKDASPQGSVTCQLHCTWDVCTISSAPALKGFCSCVFYLRWLSVNLTVQNAVVQGILVLRVWALYRGNKPVIGLAFFLYFGVCATLIGLTTTDYVAENVDVERVVALPGCYANSLPSIIVGYWITPLAIESKWPFVLFFKSSYERPHSVGYLFVLVTVRAFVDWKAGESGPTILYLMARDSTIYFAIIFALLLANLCMFMMGPPFLSSLLVNPLSAATCILGSRMLLNLRVAIDSRHSSSELEMPRNARHESSEYLRHLHVSEPRSPVDESDSHLVMRAAVALNCQGG